MFTQTPSVVSGSNETFLVTFCGSGFINYREQRSEDVIEPVGHSMAPVAKRSGEKDERALES